MAKWKKDSDNGKKPRRTGGLGAWARLANIASGTKSVQKIGKHFGKDPGKRWSMRKLLRTLLVDTAFLAILAVGTANLIDTAYDTADTARFGQSPYSKELAAWQDKTHKAHYAVKLAVLDFDAALAAGGNRADIERAVLQQAKRSLPPASYRIGGIFTLYEGATTDMIAARPSHWKQMMVFPSAHWRPSSDGVFDIGAHLFGRIAVIVPPQNLQVPEDYLRQLGEAYDPRITFRNLPKREELISFILGDEIGHSYDFSSKDSAFANLKRETFGDVMGVINLIATYGDDTRLPEQISDLRAIAAMNGDLSHYSTPALKWTIPIARKMQGTGKLQELSLMQRAELAQQIVTTIWDDPKTLKELKALTALVDDDMKINQSAEGLDERIQKLEAARGTRLSKAEKRLIKDYETAIASLFAPGNATENAVRYDAQLKELIAERGISDRHRRLILEHAARNLMNLETASNAMGGAAADMIAARSQVFNQTEKTLKSTGIDREMDTSLWINADIAPRFLKASQKDADATAPGKRPKP